MAVNARCDSKHAISSALALVLALFAATAAAATSQSAAASGNHELAPVGVTGVAAVKATIRALQEVKVALTRPISGNPADSNLTVCELERPNRGVHVWERMGVVLECGSNSWWLYRRDNCQTQSIADCAEGLPGAAVKPEGMWHSMKLLNSRQVVVLRKLVDTLPPPGSTRPIIVTGYTPAPLVVTGLRSTATDAPSSGSKP